MHYVDSVFEAWQNELERYQKRPEMQILVGASVTVPLYRSYLVETYFHTRENPFSQVIAASKLPRHMHDVFRKFVTHALSEVKHDQLAVDDFLVLGGSREMLAEMSPLASTQNLIRYTYSLAELPSPIGYLGYLYHVENLPATQGDTYLKMLHANGVPKDACSFLEEHIAVDPGHNKLMKMYIKELLKTKDDFELFVSSMNKGIDMHYKMILGAFNRPISSSERKSV